MKGNEADRQGRERRDALRRARQPLDARAESERRRTIDRTRPSGRIGPGWAAFVVALVVAHGVARPLPGGASVAAVDGISSTTSGTGALAVYETRGEPVVDPVDQLAWLAGCWEGTLSSGATYEEAWLAPRGGTLIGMARMVRDGRTLSFEFLRIVDDNGTLVYVAQPSGRPPTHFRATEITSNEATFENPDHDFPQRILYRLTPPDSLRARIEGEREGELRGMDFPLRRVACPGPERGTLEQVGGDGGCVS